ncbi:winged helix-turn-helix domain-containing protein, partial [Patescibacteria group bacterium]|nr:winged helix-turn-helix domain-containing protein [Patescibacteria group bacterium]
AKNAWGLSAWSTIVPKRIRDKVLIVLEEENKPLHFNDITKLVSERFKNDKKVLSRTVHNELIGDKRFVLVGRGIYALKSWGYSTGVVSDVIKKVLADANGPLHISEIIKLVLKSRQVKRNTIVANLQNKSLFKKVAKATYGLADSSTSAQN